MHTVAYATFITHSAASEEASKSSALVFANMSQVQIPCIASLHHIRLSIGNPLGLHCFQTLRTTTCSVGTGWDQLSSFVSAENSVDPAGNVFWKNLHLLCPASRCLGQELLDKDSGLAMACYGLCLARSNNMSTFFLPPLENYTNEYDNR